MGYAFQWCSIDENDGFTQGEVSRFDKRSTFNAWKYFAKLPRGKKAKCHYYHKDFACESNTVGTFSLHKQFSRCNTYKNSIVVRKQTILTFSKSKIDGDSCESVTTTLVSMGFKKDACRKTLVKMIVVNELPFCFVEGEGFRSLII